jgi:hypothetical protein
VNLPTGNVHADDGADDADVFDVIAIGAGPAGEVVAGRDRRDAALQRDSGSYGRRS